MPHNAFYQVIKAITSKKAGFQATLLTHSVGNNYYLFDLPVKDKTTIGKYTLTKHHLSVNEVPQGKYEASQYHYTAYFVDDKKQEYRLHIFYDAQNGFVSEPLLSLVGTDKTFKDVDCQECHEDFKKLARDSIGALVASIRKDQNDKVKALLAEYDDLEKRATELSVDLVKNKQAYLLIIDRQIAVIQEIPLYANRTLGIERNIFYLRRVRKAVESYNPVAVEAVPINQKHAVVDNKAAKATSATSPLKQKKKPVAQTAAAAAGTAKSDSPVLASKAKKKKVDLQDKIKALHDQLLDEEPLTLLANLIFLEFEVDAGIYNTKPDDIQKLQRLRRKIEQIGRNLLLKALSTGAYDKADDLSAFYHLLPEEIIASALTDNNFKLLEHLIKNEFLPINYGNFKINNESYDSLMAYFFKKVAAIANEPQTAVAPAGQGAKQIAAMVDCVSVLIQNGASLFDKDPVSGLPFAAKLLLDPKHPFYAALEKNDQITIANPDFYQLLNKRLQFILQQSNITAELKTRIEQLIQTNTRLCDSLVKVKSTSITDIYKELERDITKKMTQAIGLEYIRRLQSDEDIMAIKKALRKQTLDILYYSQKNDSPTEKAKIVSIVTKNHDKTNQAITDIASDNLASMDMMSLYEQSKALAIQDSLWNFRLGALALRQYKLIDQILGYKAKNDRVAWAAASKALVQLHEELKIASSEHDEYLAKALGTLLPITTSQPATNPQAFFNSSAATASGTAVAASTLDVNSGM